MITVIYEKRYGGFRGDILELLRGVSGMFHRKFKAYKGFSGVQRRVPGLTRDSGSFQEKSWGFSERFHGVSGFQVSDFRDVSPGTPLKPPGAPLKRPWDLLKTQGFPMKLPSTHLELPRGPLSPKECR